MVDGRGCWKRGVGEGGGWRDGEGCGAGKERWGVEERRGGV